jgi:hypothetical protein
MPRRDHCHDALRRDPQISGSSGIDAGTAHAGDRLLIARRPGQNAPGGFEGYFSNPATPQTLVAEIDAFLAPRLCVH